MVGEMVRPTVTVSRTARNSRAFTGAPLDRTRARNPGKSPIWAEARVVSAVSRVTPLTVPTVLSRAHTATAEAARGPAILRMTAAKGAVERASSDWGRMPPMAVDARM